MITAFNMPIAEGPDEIENVRTWRDHHSPGVVEYFAMELGIAPPPQHLDDHLDRVIRQPPGTWIGHTTRSTPRAGTVHWCFAFNPPPGHAWFAPDALLVWPPSPAIAITAIRVGSYNVDDWRAVHAAEQNFGPTVAVACEVQPIALQGMPVFGTTAAGKQMEVQIDVYDGLDIERIAVLVRGEPIPPLRCP